MLDSREIKSFLVSDYLMNATRSLFQFLSCGFNLKLESIISIYAYVHLIYEVIFQICCSYQNSVSHGHYYEISSTLI